MKNVKINQNIIIVIKSLVLTIIAIAVLMLMLSLVRSFGIQILNDSLIGNILLEFVILIIQCLIVRKYSKAKLLNTIGFINQRDGVKYAFIGICVGLIGIVLIYSSVFIMKICFYEGTGFEFYSFKIVMIFMISFFVRALFAGICEEVFFRGVLLNYLAKYKGKIFGLIVSSMIFAVFHTTRYQSLNQLFSVLLAGFVFGYLYITTKSLYMAVGLHFATDFFINLIKPKNEAGLLILGLNTKFSLEYLTQSIFTLLSIMYLIVILVLILINKIKWGKVL